MGPTWFGVMMILGNLGLNVLRAGDEQHRHTRGHAIVDFAVTCVGLALIIFNHYRLIDS
jgi:membrane protein DedA with SNARE-associated domain